VAPPRVRSEPWRDTAPAARQEAAVISVKKGATYSHSSSLTPVAYGLRVGIGMSILQGRQGQNRLYAGAWHFEPSQLNEQHLKSPEHGAPVELQRQ
jgi:hypothetical protein